MGTETKHTPGPWTKPSCALHLLEHIRSPLKGPRLFGIQCLMDLYAEHDDMLKLIDDCESFYDEYAQKLDPNSPARDESYWLLSRIADVRAKIKDGTPVPYGMDAMRTSSEKKALYRNAPGTLAALKDQHRAFDIYIGQMVMADSKLQYHPATKRAAERNAQALVAIAKVGQ